MDIKIKLTSITQVKELITMTKSLDYNVYLEDKHKRVNGKSILSVLTLDLSHPINLHIKSNDFSILDKFKHFTVS